MASFGPQNAADDGPVPDDDAVCEKSCKDDLMGEAKCPTAMACASVTGVNKRFLRLLRLMGTATGEAVGES